MAGHTVISSSQFRRSGFAVTELNLDVPMVVGLFMLTPSLRCPAMRG